MSAQQPISYRIGDAKQRIWLASLVDTAPEGHYLTIKPPTRSLEQNDKLHALFRDVAKSDAKWNGKRRSAEEWKWLLVSAHAEAAGYRGEFGIGLEGERIMLRPSTAAMSVAEMSSLLEYCISWAVSHGIPLSDRAELQATR